MTNRARTAVDKLKANILVQGWGTAARYDGVARSTLEGPDGTPRPAFVAAVNEKWRAAGQAVPADADAVARAIIEVAFGRRQRACLSPWRSPDAPQQRNAGSALHTRYDEPSGLAGQHRRHDLPARMGQDCAPTGCEDRPDEGRVCPVLRPAHDPGREVRPPGAAFLRRRPGRSTQLVDRARPDPEPPRTPSRPDCTTRCAPPRSRTSRSPTPSTPSRRTGSMPNANSASTTTPPVLRHRREDSTDDE